LERREDVGGAAVTEEAFPGFKFETGAHRIGPLHPQIARELESSRADGPTLTPSDPSLFAPSGDGGGLMVWRDPERTVEALRRFSRVDADRWLDFTALIAKAARLLAWIYERPPPDPLASAPTDLVDLFRLAARVRRIGRRDMLEVLRILPMTVRELLDDWFETDLLKGALGAGAITGLFQGPMASGTAFMFLHQHAWAPRGAIRPLQNVRGGAGAFTRALAELARGAGAELRTAARVERIKTEDGRATGVILAGGEEIGASRVVSNADPRRTYLGLVEPLELEPTFLRHVRNLKYRGCCAKVNLALGELPKFKDAPDGDAHMRGAFSISPSLEYLERAYDDAKYGAPSGRPVLDAVIPTLGDPSLAPPGKHVMSILVQYAPYHLKEKGWDAQRREALGDAVIETLAAYAPNLPAAILHRQVLTPLDLEDMFGLTEGNIYHGEMTLDQVLFMRPVQGWSRYRTPIERLYLCGAGTHPGGGVTGAPGYNAAQVVLQDIGNSE
jgi:phytoene dehydrogenase-like protein